MLKVVRAIIEQNDNVDGRFNKVGNEQTQQLFRQLGGKEIKLSSSFTIIKA